MKKIASIVLLLFVVSLIPLNFAQAGAREDFQKIKKAVKDNPNYSSGNEAKWLKVLITDNETKKDKVKVTLPLALVEVFMRAADDKHLCMNRDDYDIDIKELFAELKKLGPMALIEVYEDGETIKVWLE